MLCTSRISQVHLHVYTPRTCEQSEMIHMRNLSRTLYIRVDAVNEAEATSGNVQMCAEEMPCACLCQTAGPTLLRPVLCYNFIVHNYRLKLN